MGPMGNSQQQSEPQLKKAGLVKEISLVGFTTELAIKLAVPVIVLSLVGRWLDHLFGTEVIYVVLGTVVGITIASFLAVRRVLGIIKQADQEYESQKSHNKEEKTD